VRVEGACHCGAIAFEAEVDPARTSICHCGDCQTLSGSPFRASVPAAPETFRILVGEPALYVKTAESGAKRVQAFCRDCGSPLYATAFNDPSATFNIRVGVIRERDAFVPTKQIWTRSSQPWVDRIASIPSLDRQSN
jgi:hypothetical protein